MLDSRARITYCKRNLQPIACVVMPGSWQKNAAWNSNYALASDCEDFRELSGSNNLNDCFNNHRMRDDSGSLQKNAAWNSNYGLASDCEDFRELALSNNLNVCCTNPGITSYCSMGAEQWLT